MDESVIIFITGLGAMLIGRILWDWLKNRNGNGKKVACVMNTATVTQIQDMHKTVQREDDDGGKRIYSQRGMLEGIHKQTAEMSEMTAKLTVLIDVLKAKAIR